MNRTDYMSLGLIVTGIALGLFFYSDLPDPMPTHFGLDGRPDDYTSLPWGAFILPLVGFGVWLLMRLLPVISPKEFSMDLFRSAFGAVIVGIITLLIVIQFILLQTAIHPGFNPSPWVRAAVGALFLIVANYMTKTEPNFFFGIRTPWTLANEEVWFRTHRQAAYWFAAAGLLSILSAPFASGTFLTVGGILLAALWPVLYSYLTYNRLNRIQADTDGEAQSTSTPTGQ